jgi:hypothetical protein
MADLPVMADRHHLFFSSLVAFRGQTASNLCPPFEHWCLKGECTGGNLVRSIFVLKVKTQECFAVNKVDFRGTCGYGWAYL